MAFGIRVPVRLGRARSPLFLHQGEEMEFTHFDDLGNAHMVDVSDKSVTGRSAYAVGTIRMNREAFSAITGGKVQSRR